MDTVAKAYDARSRTFRYRDRGETADPGRAIAVISAPGGSAVSRSGVSPTGG